MPVASIGLSNIFPKTKLSFTPSKRTADLLLKLLKFSIIFGAFDPEFA